MKHTSREIIFNESTFLLDPQRQFLSNLANKEFSFRKLASHFENVGICTFVATDDADVYIVKTTIETYEKIKKQIVIGQDVDILVLLTALTPDHVDILMLKEGPQRSAGKRLLDWRVTSDATSEPSLMWFRWQLNLMKIGKQSPSVEA
ncbi:hypothetical protein AVEN_242995-1 [Araneus ventricosus]|uniref:Uncharacterized protein n=1 Tax=Araneus ventricosus TaxID=182803 RepID=A0A4Y2D6B6_ARAVE|nr:hypothetical protein AVEN_242995-1 [Araneus ventricosus]